MGRVKTTTFKSVKGHNKTMFVRVPTEDVVHTKNPHMNPHLNDSDLLRGGTRPTVVYDDEGMREDTYHVPPLSRQERSRNLKGPNPPPFKYFSYPSTTSISKFEGRTESRYQDRLVSVLPQLLSTS